MTSFAEVNKVFTEVWSRNNTPTKNKTNSLYIPSTGRSWTKDELVTIVKEQCDAIGIPYEVLNDFSESESEDKYYEIPSGT